MKGSSFLAFTRQSWIRAIMCPSMKRLSVLFNPELDFFTTRASTWKFLGKRPTLRRLVNGNETLPCHYKTSRSYQISTLINPKTPTRMFSYLGPGICWMTTGREKYSPIVVLSVSDYYDWVPQILRDLDYRLISKHVSRKQVIMKIRHPRLDDESAGWYMSVHVYKVPWLL